MIRLDTITRKLQALLSGAVTTNQLPIVVCWSDQTATAFSGSATPSNTNSTTAVDIVAAPASSTVRQIDSITCVNSDTAAATITFRYNDNGTTYNILKVALAVGDQLTYTHGIGWAVLDSNGNVKTGATETLTGDVTGSGSGSIATTIANDAVTNAKLANMATQTFKGRTTAGTGDPEDLTVAQTKNILAITWNSQVFTANGTFTTPAGTISTTLFKFTLTGAGGGGGGVAGSVNFSAAGGGGAGASAIYYVTGLSASTGYSITVGAGGAGGAAGNNNGANGGNSVVVAGATVTAPGGSGGIGSASGGAQGGAGGTVSTNGTINLTGQDGGLAQTNGVNILFSGFGGNSIWGGGAKATSNVAGVAAGGYGSGGSGASDATVTNQAGGAGKGGIVVVEWML